MNCLSKHVESSNAGWSENTNWVWMAIVECNATQFLTYCFDQVCFPTTCRAINIEKLLLDFFISDYAAIRVDEGVEDHPLLWCKPSDVDWFRPVVFNSLVAFLLVKVGSHFVNIIPPCA